jgi:hypothetical protein
LIKAFLPVLGLYKTRNVFLGSPSGKSGLNKTPGFLGVLSFF